ncbi:TIGR01906 family membrane protein [Enterococcus thailandicus]|nr:MULTISPECIES: TIGR01906 family membrane protein [Enterococcus]MDK4352116.1 TIGR01906 family membrane protein [Enterococcus thailandicus]MDT2733079.1 TIGR01906 family membrane protein [Enterococcus thailandicus]MDT2745342.1 TIGR01906 family membrane protein [Enterococcus asini]
MEILCRIKLFYIFTSIHIFYIILYYDSLKEGCTIHINRLKIGFSFLTIFVFALSHAISVTINFPGLLKINLLFQDASNFDIWNRSQVNIDFRNLMSYLNNPFQKSLKFDYLFLSNRGINHFKDVKLLFQLNYSILILSGLVLFWLFYKKILLREQAKIVSHYLKIFWISFCLIALLFFEKSFVVFHELFFTNNDWIFNYETDPIILFLPESFFLACFVLIFLINFFTLSKIHLLFNKKDLV